jgi:hypothetical protein
MRAKFSRVFRRKPTANRQVLHQLRFKTSVVITKSLWQPLNATSSGRANQGCRYLPSEFMERRKLRILIFRTCGRFNCR